MIKITTSERQFFNNEELQKMEIQEQIQKAKVYLLSSDYKMTVDYFISMTEEEQREITEKRAEARNFIRENETIEA